MLDVILVHGFPLDRRLWEQQLVAAPKDLRLHAIDLPGFGNSTESPASSVEAMADAVHRASAGMKRFALGGVSMGGYVVLAYWRKYGHEKRVAGLVLADTKETADSPEAKVDRNGVISLVEAQGVSPLAVRMLPRLVSSEANEGVRRELRTIMESQRVEAVIAATEAMRDRPDSSDLLPTIDVPVLAIGGELDVITPPGVMAAMASKLPNAKHHVSPAVGHLPWWERPAEFNQALFSFLSTLS